MIYVFAIQLVGKRTLQGLVERVKTSRAVCGALVALVSFAVVALVLLKNEFVSKACCSADGGEVPMEVIGQSLLGSEKYQYVLAFDFISVFLLACIIGGIVVSRKEEEK